MGAIDLSDLPEGALLLLDSAPIIYVLEQHPVYGPRFRPIFELHEQGRVVFAVTTVTIVEVLSGPLPAGDDALAHRYRSMLHSWRVVPLDTAIADGAAKLRGAHRRLKLPDAVQLASALAIDADALVTHDHDFSRITALRVIS